MPNRNISDERHECINNPNYLYKCTKCGEIKPNVEYSRDKNQAKGRGRGYVTQCKKCRNLYSSQENVKQRKKETEPIQRKKHRINLIYWASVTNARRRKLEHNIDINYIKQIFIDQKGLCFYTNKPMLIDIREEKDNNNSVSIDRVDSSKGYIRGNIVLCRWIVNRMKNDIDHSTFLELVADIHTKFNL